MSAASIDIEALQAAVAYLQVLKETREEGTVKREQVAAAVNANLARFRDRVRLNVGGMRFETTLSTLRRYEDSMLGTMFSGREGISVPTDNDDCVFIDRDGTHFRTILNFLRTGQLAAPPQTHRERVELLVEARFYLLEEGITAALEKAEAAYPQFTRKEIQETLVGQRASCVGDVAVHVFCPPCGRTWQVDMQNSSVNCKFKLCGHTISLPVTRLFENVQLTRCRNFRSYNLTGVDLSKLDLADADFTMANLTGACFDETTLDGANFSKAVMTNASFVGASLKACKLPRASSMKSANLQAANMEGVTYED